MISALWLVFLALLVAWVIGFAVNWGTLAWVLLIAAIAVLAVNLVAARRVRRWY